MKALSSSTKAFYKYVNKRFVIFAKSNNFSSELPIHQEVISSFIAHLFNQGAAFTSVNSYLSALSYFHKINDLPDSTKNFNVRQILKGYRNSAAQRQSRQPLSLREVTFLYQSITALGLDTYSAKLFGAMLTLAFFLGLRIGEMTSSPHNILSENVTLNNDSIIVRFHSFKHSKASSTHILRAMPSSFCPVKIIAEYMAVRGESGGPFFIHSGKAISRSFFSKNFEFILKHSGFDPVFYTPHSLRISAARFWASKGLSDNQIRLQGRWQSNAFKKYMKGAIQHK